MSVAERLTAKNGNVLIVNAGMRDYTADVGPIRFRQSLLNLLSNACKFTECGTFMDGSGYRAMGGLITVESEIRVGSAFTIQLPLGQSATEGWMI